VAAVRGPGRPGLRRCCQGGLACPAIARTHELEAGRAKITGSREDAKFRLEKNNFLPGPSGRAGGAARRQGPSGATAVIRQAGPAARQAFGGTGGRSGLRARRGWSQANETGNDGGSLLLLEENYNQTTNDLTTEAQSAQRTHRDFLAEVSLPSSACRSLQAAGSCARQQLTRILASGSRFWPPPVGQLACLKGDRYRGSRRPVGPEGQVEPEPGKGLNMPLDFLKRDIAA